VLSFHATKVFTTFEGGAIVCPDAKTKQRIYYLKNFGFADEVTVVAPGINGKMCEVSAALGLLQLRHVDQSIAARREIYLGYRERLTGLQGLQLVGDEWLEGNNFSHFPILITDEHLHRRDEVCRRMREAGVFVRRYFYPLISDIPLYRGLPSAQRDNLPVAWSAAERVLCLPIYEGLTADDIGSVIGPMQELAA
jgi:dTDP-4-amino-4,6-dideoxygalactose transaminase